MPELPEVEVTRRSVAGGLLGARVRDVQMGLPLRWPLGHDPRALVGTACGQMSRRGKYLWLPLARAADAPARHLPGLPRAAEDAEPESAGGLLIHLGMSGALAFGEAPAERGPYDHFRLLTDRGCLWLTDPRRFGAVVWSPALDAEPARKLLSSLGPEPFDPALDEAGFHAGLQARRTPVKAALLSGELVVGAGNIYACEALHLARIDPRTPANRISRPRACWRRCARCCARRSRPAGRRCATSAPTAPPAITRKARRSTVARASPAIPVAALSGVSSRASVRPFSAGFARSASDIRQTGRDIGDR